MADVTVWGHGFKVLAETKTYRKLGCAASNVIVVRELLAKEGIKSADVDHVVIIYDGPRINVTAAMLTDEWMEQENAEAENDMHDMAAFIKAEFASVVPF